MKKIEKVKWLYIVYVMMLGILFVLTFTNNTIDITSIIINIIMFVVVFLIFYRCMINMKKVQDLTNDLQKAIVQIQDDYQATNTYLWDVKQESYIDKLFEQQELSEAFKKYGMERRRLEGLHLNRYKCSIDDYINEELVDVVMKKNVLNLVPGVMTGLGILGTFIGLSIGLQNFNTGTSDEIANSIAPLMNGIRVAFHTSIYGMMFSLSYNYIYKAVLEDAYIAVAQFLEIFEKYVDSDANRDNNSTVQVLLQTMPETIGTQIAEILTPAVNRMNDTLENFTKNIADSQVKGVAEIVDHFMVVMNESFANSFVELRETLDETCKLQRESGELMKNALSEAGAMVGNIMSINEISIKIVESMSGYVQNIEELQGIINENFVSFNIQLKDQREYDEKLKEYLEILVTYERQIGEASNRFTEDMSKQIETLSIMEDKISESTREHLEMLANKADEYNKTLTEVAKQELQGVLSMANEYSGKIVHYLDSLDNMSNVITDKAKISIGHISETSRSEIEVVASLAEKYQEKIEKHFDILEIMNQNVLKETERHLEILTEQAEKQMNKLLDISNNCSGEMREASIELSKVCMQLNSDLSEALTNAFNVIDQNLADITKHLSGTIAEVDETTARVPQVVNASYEGMKESFKEMQKKYDALIDALNIMVENLKKHEINENDQMQERKE